MFNLSIISRICEQFQACRTPECRKAKSDWLLWNYKEYIPWIREDLKKSSNTEQLKLVDEMVALYKEPQVKRQHMSQANHLKFLRERKRA